MQFHAYTLHDNKSLTYSPPFFAVTDGAATRIVQDAANDMSTSLGRHPSDYVLYRIGSFDDSNAALAWLSPIVHVVDLVVLVQKPVNRDLFSEAMGLKPRTAEEQAHDNNTKE